MTKRTPTALRQNDLVSQNPEIRLTFTNNIRAALWRHVEAARRKIGDREEEVPGEYLYNGSVANQQGSRRAYEFARMSDAAFREPEIIRRC